MAAPSSIRVFSQDGDDHINLKEGSRAPANLRGSEAQVRLCDHWGQRHHEWHDDEHDLLGHSGSGLVLPIRRARKYTTRAMFS